MTIIDAWNAAKVGQKIRDGRGGILIKRESDYDSTVLVSALIGCDGKRMSDFHVLASDWEVVKIPHKERMEMGTLRSPSSIMLHIPDDARVTIEWEG